MGKEACRTDSTNVWHFVEDFDMPEDYDDLFHYTWSQTATTDSLRVILKVTHESNRISYKYMCAYRLRKLTDENYSWATKKPLKDRQEIVAWAKEEDAEHIYKRYKKKH